MEKPVPPAASSALSSAFPRAAHGECQHCTPSPACTLIGLAWRGPISAQSDCGPPHPFGHQERAVRTDFEPLSLYSRRGAQRADRQKVEE
jgi:hypothetical protein